MLLGRRLSTEIRPLKRYLHLFGALASALRRLKSFVGRLIGEIASGVPIARHTTLNVGCGMCTKSLAVLPRVTSPPPYDSSSSFQSTTCCTLPFSYTLASNGHRRVRSGHIGHCSNLFHYQMAHWSQYVLGTDIQLIGQVTRRILMDPFLVLLLLWYVPPRNS
jgi:hypothetical protein